MDLALPIPPPPPPPAAAPAPAAPPTSRKAVWALVCGVTGLVTGFLLVPLLLAVTGNVLAALAFEDMDRAGGRLEGRGLAVAGVACATTAIVVWSGVAVVAAARAS